MSHSTLFFCDDYSDERAANWMFDSIDFFFFPYQYPINLMFFGRRIDVP